jgi:hypothetical protein
MMAQSDLAGRLTALSGLSTLGTPSWKDELDAAEVELHLPVADVSWPSIQSAADAGLRIRITMRDSATGELVLETTAGGAFAVEARGEFDQSLGGEALAQFRDACASSRPEAILAIVKGNTEAHCTLWSTLENKPTESGCHWVRSRHQLLADLSQPDTAVALARRLAATSDVRHLVVADATAVLVSTPVLLVHGPVDWPAAPTEEWMDDAAAAYAQTFQSHWADLRIPSPIAYTAILSPAHDSELTAAFRRLAELLAWSWLSVDSRHLRFEGVRTIEFKPLFPETGSLESTLSLWRWAVSSTGADKREALQRAITLSVFTVTDLQQTPSILKNARWFLDLAQRDAVAEALSTRRQVREAALTMAAGTASRASDATSKAFDRVAIQVAAAVGIIFAQYKALLDPTSAARLLAAVVGLLVVSGLLSVAVDFRFIAQSLRAFKHDLHAYRETLSSDDIAAITKLQSLTRASEQNCQRWKAAIVLHAVVIAAILAAIVVMLQSQILRLLP